MSDTTSAVPADLQTFVTNGGRARPPLSEQVTSLTSLQSSVQAASPDYGVAGSALPAAERTMADLAATETFVQTVHDELLAADNLRADGVATVANTAIATALAETGYVGPHGPVLVTPSAMYGLPPTSGFVDDPICAANGNFVHQDIDLVLPGRAAVLDVVRTYNSLATHRTGAFGPGWTSVLDLHLRVAADGVVWVTLADGALVPFVDAGDGTHRPSGSRPLHLTADDGGGWILHEGHVKAWRFDADGRFVGGSAGVARLRVDRDATGRVVSLTEERSGRAVRLTWQDERVVAAETSDGRVSSYRYDDDGVLVGVERPEGRQTFEVDGALIVGVADADGVRLAANVYDGDGRVAEQTNELGRTTRYQYTDHGTTLVSDTVEGPRNAFTHDLRGNLTSLVDGLGRAMRLTYDDAGHVTRIVDRTGAVTEYAFDDRGELVGRTDPDGLGQAWTWDDAGRLVAETHRNGATTTYGYDGDHRQPSRIVGPDGAEVRIVVSADDLPAEIVDADGIRSSFEYDDDGQLTAAVDALGRRTTVRYDEAGLPVELVDATGGVIRLVNDDAGRMIESAIGDAATRFAYTAAGRPIRGVDAVGQSWDAAYGEHGRLDTFTDGEGSTVGYEWDLFGNVAAVIAPDGGRYGHVYDAANNLIAAFDPEGNTSRRELDGEGRVVVVEDPTGRRWERELDRLGRTVVSVDPAGNRTRYEHDALGLVARVVHPDGHSVSAERDPAGRVVAIVDEGGARYEMSYSAAGRLTERRWPSGRTERWTYGPTGNVTAIEHDDETVRFELDALGRVLAADGPRGQVRYDLSANGDLLGAIGTGGAAAYEHDAAGRLVGIIDGEGGHTSYAWDRRGQVDTVTDPSGLVSRVAHDVRGRLATAFAPTGESTTFGYDPIGWISAVGDALGTTTNRRDAAGRVIGVVRPDGTQVDYTLDALGRTASVDVDGRTTRSYAYDERGRLSEALSVADDLRTTFAWDPVGRLDAVTGPGGDLRAGRDADGRLAEWTQDGVRVGVRRGHAGRIVGFDDPTLGPVEGPTRRLVERDLAGRISADGTGATYRYDEAGRLVEALDAQGRQRSFRYGTDGLLAAELAPDGEITYRRGFLGRVDSVVHPDGRETTYGYDARGRRSEQRDPDGLLTRYHWDDGDALVGLDRVRPDGTVEPHRFSIDALGRPVRIDDAAVLWDDLRHSGPLQIGDDRYLTLRGQRRRVGVDETWTTPTTDPWGADDVDEPHVGFRSSLAAYGLVWMGARVYDPATREFLSPDPLLAVPGRAGAASVYSYGFLDPVNFLDPSGLRPISQEEYDAIRTQQEQGRLGQAWEAIQSDPWGTLAMVGVAAIGVGLCFVPGGQAIGVGILIGVGTSAAMGLATGNFNPREVAVGGAFGAIPGGSTLRSALLVGAATGVASDVTTQLVTTGTVDPSSFATSALLGTGGGALGHGINTHLGGARTAADDLVPPTTGGSGGTGGGPRFVVDSDGVVTDLHNPIPPAQAPTVPRLPQDINVNPSAPDPLPLNRPVGGSPTQNAHVQQRIVDLQAEGAFDMRVNQQQVDINGNRVGVNRPDLQYTTPDGNRVYEEFDTSSSNRGPGHRDRILANDPSGEVNLFTVD